ncbi:thiamine kinase-like enzyme [Salirhabdus euzebyi]|uniref:Thiamine kinase-like enzyme n=1 Tax=Salirhabdus euzebyi TaxID=394506 RepID=A0A841PTM8_9BACI|nr:phosphotransferase family protein [Salirhabdus euzebyi]MBB6452160.1 thiamine kinase-like enzyme [Salirhabdus euzebyi]
MEQVLGKEWTISPAGGSTGEAYYAQLEEKRLFLKRNSSPFLAVLSAEGIVPKLVWTKRLENGDVITAQHWLEGRELKPLEMKFDRVAALLSKIHHSTELLHLFMRIEKKPLEPEMILNKLRQSQIEQNQVETNIDVHKAIKYLTEQLPVVQNQRKVVCHCDVNHNNWLLADDNQLYLIDWDNAMIADPAMDIGMLLHKYIPESNWNSWLEKYGVQMDVSLMNRIYWYVIAQSVTFIQWHQKRKEFSQAVKWEETLQSIFVKMHQS